MIFNGFNIIKFISGFFIWRGQNFGKVIFVIIIALACIIAYNKFTKPTKQTTQEAQAITNITNVKEDDTFWFKLQIWGLKIQI